MRTHANSAHNTTNDRTNDNDRQRTTANDDDGQRTTRRDDGRRATGAARVAYVLRARRTPGRRCRHRTTTAPRCDRYFTTVARDQSAWSSAVLACSGKPAGTATCRSAPSPPWNQS